MRQMDKVMVLGAWVMMVGVGTLSAWKVSETPKVQPWVAAMERELAPRAPQMPAPPKVPAWRNPFVEWIPESRPITKGGDAPPIVGTEVPPPPPAVTDLFVPPSPVLGEAKADLNGTTLSWTLLAAPPRKLASHVSQRAGKPAGFVVQRQAKGEVSVETLAELGPEARSYTDLTARPRKTYRYWVQLQGEEITRSSYSESKKKVTLASAAAEATSPAATRLKLVGGDKAHAFLKVETYDRTQKKWIEKIVQAAPGRVIGTSGWTLKALRFDNFTLVAELTDDEGVDRALTTKD
jgi:hypothetical protein